MLSTDVIVVLPGIMGSTLAHHGRPVWAVSPGTLIDSVLNLGRQLSVLRLPEGVGDDHPGDGIAPGELMPTLHGIPGVWTPVKGYTELLTHLRRLGYREAAGADHGNLVVVAYDWRLSNRYNGRRLQRIVEPALERWRARGGRYTDAQLVFVCHSMGGLVARWYIEKEGGAEVTRKLITLGTPYRGAVKALVQLVEGVPRKVGRLGPDLTDLVRSFPSMYQLAPEYACLSRGTDLLRTTETSIPGLPSSMSAMLADGVSFHTELRHAEDRRGQRVHDMTHVIAGIRQTTDTTATLQGGHMSALTTYGPEQLYGDGTVPLAGGMRAGLPLDSPLLRRIADKHGNLQRNSAALDEIEGALTGQGIIVRAAAPVQPRVDAPELVSAAEPISVTVDLGENHGIRVTLRDERGAEIDTLVPKPSRGVAHATFGARPPGGYTIDVVGLAAASPVATVSSDLMVWAP